MREELEAKLAASTARMDDLARERQRAAEASALRIAQVWSSGSLASSFHGWVAFAREARRQRDQAGVLDVRAGPVRR